MKRIVNLLLMGCISLSLVGCAASESNADKEVFNDRNK